MTSPFPKRPEAPASGRWDADGLEGRDEMRESNTVRRAKKRARDMSRNDGTSHQQALDAIAIEAGHAHWAAMLAAHPPGSKAIVADPSASPLLRGCVIENGVLVVPDGSGAGPFRRDAFASEWLHLASRGGETVQDHFRSAALLVSDPKRAVEGVTDLIALCAVSYMVEHGDGGLDGPSLRTMFLDRLAVAERRCRARRAEQSAAKQTVDCSVLSMLIEEVTACSDELALPMSSVLLTVRNDDPRADLIVSQTRTALDRCGLPTVPEIGGHTPTGVGTCGLVLFSGSSPIPLVDDERRMAVESLRAASITGDMTAQEALSVLKERSSGLADLHSTAFHMGRLDPGILSTMLRIDDRAFPEASGRIDDFFESLVPGLQRMSELRETFPRWITDAVSKAIEGKRPFRYDPLCDVDMKGLPEQDVRLRILSKRMSELGSVRMSVADVEPAFTSLVALAARGAARGTLSEICRTRPVERVGMVTIVKLFDSLMEIGFEQASLYATVNLFPVDHEAGLESIFEPVVLEVLGNALKPFRHPAIAAAC
jgi:hypothetical protein